MVKKSNKTKSTKTEESTQIEDNASDPIEELASDNEENGETDQKKKPKSKVTKKEEENEENGEDIQENGAEAEKKKPSSNKTKVAVKKPAAEPERKSSRQPKPLLKQEDKIEKVKGKGQKRNSSKSPAPTKKAKPTKEEKNYEVEEVVGMRVKGGKKEFKIRWKGYKPSEDTWEPEKHLSCQDLIKTYMMDHKEENSKASVKGSKASVKSKSVKKSKAK